jgi:hypothetical protein
MKKKIIYIILIMLGFFRVSAQDQPYSSQIPPERADFTTDRNVYINGEIIWVSAYILGNDLAPTELSTVLYLELLSENNDPVIQQKWRILDGKAAGYLVIPEDLPSGVYQLRAYTKYMKNFGSCSFPMHEITILNTDQILPSNDSSQKTKILLDSTEHNSVNNQTGASLRISTPKIKYHSREEISLILTDESNAFQHLPLQISVVLSGSYSTDSINGFVDIQKQDIASATPGKLQFLPENRDLTISGTVRNKATKVPLASVEIFASLVSDQPQLHIQKTDDEGKFVFNLMNLYGNQNIFFNVKTNSSEEIEILLHQDFSGEFCHNLHRSIIDIDTSDRLLINNMLLNRQVNKVFPVYPASVTLQENATFFLFGKPSQIIYPADFVDLDSFEEVFKEIVPFVIIRRHPGKAHFEVQDSKRNLVYNDPLVMLDQIPVFDVDALLKINPKRIKQIEVINQPYVYGETTFNGIIQIRTNTRDFAGIKMPSSSVFVDYQCITPTSQFFERMHIPSKEQPSSLPDFRTTVYWNPDFSMNGKEKKIRFYAPDNKSKLDVILTCIYEGRIQEISRFVLEVE